MWWRDLLAVTVVAVGLLCRVPAAAQATPDLMRQADGAYRAGKLNEAAQLFEQALSKALAFLPARMMLGLIRAQQGRTEQAVKHFQAVVEADPPNPHAHFYLGRLLSAQAQWRQAARHFSAALRSDAPDRETATIGLAVAQVEMGEAARALSHLQGMSEPKDPRKAASYFGALGSAQRELGKFRESAAAFQSARELQSNNPAYHEQLVRAFLSAGDFTAALTAAVPAQKRFPDHPGMQFVFGLAGFRVRESPFTKLALRNLRDTHPSNARVVVLEGLIHWKNSRVEEARAALIRGRDLGVDEAAVFLKELSE